MSEETRLRINYEAHRDICECRADQEKARAIGCGLMQTTTAPVAAGTNKEAAARG